jgi:DNA polymerase-1
MAGQRVVLVDGTGLLLRAWHAIPGNLKTTGGLPTNALFGFAQMFRKVLAAKRPAYGAVVFDAGGRTFRSEMYPAYKSARPPLPDGLVPQLPYVDKLVAAHHFPIVRVPGVEADDVIGALTARALGQGHDVWVVSGDKDLAQLVAEDVRMLDSTKEVLYDPEMVFRKWGVRPPQIPDLLGLVGDPADGIPGVDGVGEKTAMALLAEHGTMEGVLAAAAAGKVAGRVGARLVAQADQARLSLQLATLRVDVELPLDIGDLSIAMPAPEDLDEIYLELEFWSLLSPSAASRLPKPTTIRYYVCDTLQMGAAALAAECSKGTPVAIHVLVEEPDHLKGDLVGIALSPGLGAGFWYPFAGPGQHLGPQGLELLKDWLEDPAIPKVAHEHKKAVVALARHGVMLAGVVGDSALASYLVDPTKHLPHRLEQVAREYLHVGLQPLRGLLGSGKKRLRFAELTVDKAGAWACHCADAAGAAWRALEPRLRGEGLWDLWELDRPLSYVLARMELVGVRMDPEVLQRAGERLQAERAGLGDELAELAGKRFNPGSHRQVGQILFEELGLPVIRRTKTGYSVEAEVLEELADQHPIIPLLLRWRTVDKLINTYTDVLLAAIGPDGRIHPTFSQTVASSGRLITTEPDLQRTPVRTEEFRELRESFVASDGCVLVSADFSQIELRVLAHVTGDPALQSAYREARDIHRATASALFELPPEQVTDAQRNIAKTVNFATIYGQGPLALSRQLQIPVAEARKYIATFFREYAGVDAWRRRVVKDAVVNGFVTTVLGRRRYIPELFSNDPNEVSYGERIATNTPIQGSAADLCKVAMLRVDRALAEHDLAASMVLQIHDELLLDVPEEEVETVVPLVREAMEGAAELEVPLVVEIGVGKTWGLAH